MKSIDPNNLLVIQEISKRKTEMNEQFKQAKILEESHQYFESLRLYEKARHSSYPVGKGLKATIMIETIDQKNWHKINKKVEDVKIKIKLQKPTYLGGCIEF